MSSERDADRAALAEILPKSAHKKIDAVLDYFGPHEGVARVEIRGARVQIEQIDAHGLVIGLDPNGNAVSVEFRDGADVTEVWP